MRESWRGVGQRPERVPVAGVRLYGIRTRGERARLGPPTVCPELEHVDSILGVLVGRIEGLLRLGAAAEGWLDGVRQDDVLELAADG